MNEHDLRQYQDGTGDPRGILAVRAAWLRAYPEADIVVREVLDRMLPSGMVGTFVRLRLDGYCTHVVHRGEVTRIAATCSRGIPLWHKVDDCLWTIRDPDSTFVETVG